MNTHDCKSCGYHGKGKQGKPGKSPAFIVAMGNILGDANECCWLTLPIQTSVFCTNQPSPKS